MARLYREEPAKVGENAQAIRKHVDPVARRGQGRHGQPPALLDQASAHMARLFDVRYGGFGTAPKFPHPGAVRCS